MKAASPKRAHCRICQLAAVFSHGSRNYRMSTKRETAYKIFKIELDEEIPEIKISEGYSGFALIIRHHDAPIGFFMEALPEGSVLSPDEVAARIVKQAGPHLLAEKIREELVE